MIIDRLRQTLRDPFYRAECRQAQFWKTAGLWALALIPLALAVTLCALPFMVVCCCMGLGPVSCVLVVPLGCLPACLGAESVLIERQRDTLEGLLLTTVPRSRIVWAKLLAWEGPLIVMGLFLAALAAAGTVLAAMDAWDDRRLAVLLGSVAAIVIGLGVGGQSIACGSLGLYSALLGRTRVRSYLYAVAMVFGVGLVDCVVFGGLCYYCWMFSSELSVPSDFRDAPGAVPSAGPWLAAFMGFVVLAAFVVRFGLLSVLLPWLVLRSSARRMDLALLKD